MTSKCSTVIVLVLVAGAACGKDKGTSKGSGGPAATCAQAAAFYADLDLKKGGNELYALKPTPEELKVVVGKLEASCNEGWSAETRSCVMTMKPELGADEHCWEGRGELMVMQVVHDTVNDLKAKRAPTP